MSLNVSCLVVNAILNDIILPQGDRISVCNKTINAIQSPVTLTCDFLISHSDTDMLTHWILSLLNTTYNMCTVNNYWSCTHTSIYSPHIFYHLHCTTTTTSVQIRYCDINELYNNYNIIFCYS